MRPTSAFLAVALLASGLAHAQVPYDRIVNGASEPHNWLTYFGDYGGVRHRTLDQINAANVKDLRMEWAFQVPKPGRFQTVPLVVDGVMYFTGPDGWAFAADARSGRELWRFHHQVPEKAVLPAGTLNRGFAILDDRLYMGTPEGRLLCLSARSGELLWNVEVAPNAQGFGISMAPLAATNKIIVGVAGGEFGIRGFLDAYDAATGKRAWRWWAIPGKGEPGNETWSGDSWTRGGAPTWMTGTYDPQLQTLYWGIGNAGPDLDGTVRKGDNLYTSSIVALDVHTGKLKWHFQNTPHDTHDWDSAQTPMLLDLPWKGQPRKLLVQGNRNAFFYVLDRVTGEFLMATPFGRQTWAKEIDAKGRPVLMPENEASPQGTFVCPGLAGGGNWMAPSYNPRLKLLFLPYFEECQIYYATPQTFQPGKPYWGGSSRTPENEKREGILKALDPLTGQAKWTFTFHKPSWGGTLSTDGDIVFAGDEDGYFVAFDARSGKPLWKTYTGAPIATAPMTYKVKGKQFVSVASGGTLFTFTLP